MSASIDVSEVMQLAADIDRNADHVPGKARLIVTKWGHDVQAAAQAGAPVDTGNLRSSISADVDGLSFEVGPTAEYGGFVEEGTHGPYAIPNAFGWGVTVMHPGEAPQPYMAPAFDRQLEHGLAAFGDLAGQILGRGR